MRKAITFLFITSCLVSCSSGNPDESENTEALQPEESKVEQEIADSSSITCPQCGYTTIEELPTEVCLLAYDCDSCSYTMHPAEDDCCVFCTHGTEKCPSIQEKEE